MKKVAQLLTAIIVSVGVVGNVAGAQVAQTPDCTSIVITNTGANSNNSGTCIVNTSVTATCVNNIYMLNQNDQTAVTGQASSLGNTSSNPAITGNATNTNGTSVQIGAACGQTTTSTTPTATEPTTPSTGAGQAPEVKKVAALPYTASSDTASIAIIATAVALGAFVAARVGTAIYRRIALK